MARKKRKSSRRRSRGRRRVGAISQNTSQTLALAGGVVMGVMATRFVKKFIPPPTDPAKVKSREYLVAGGEVLAGGALAYYSKNALLKGVGLGLAAGGALQVGQTAGIISGVGAIGDSFMLPTSGTSQLQRIGNGNVVNNYPKPSAIGKHGIGNMIG
jgi:hypothetical protein